VHRELRGHVAVDHLDISSSSRQTYNRLALEV
jgi:hypothetical protein